MEKDNENTILKIRSSQACIRDGYGLYTSKFRRIFRITWPLALIFAVLSAVASALPVLVSPTLVLPAMALGTLIVILLLVACNKRLRKHQMLEPIGHIGFGTWMRHLGQVIIVAIVCLLVVSVLTLLTSLPTIIIMAANWESQIGVINGDPAGMPEHVRWLSIGVFLIAGFLQAYVWMSVVIPFYFTRISIILQEKERLEFNKKNNEKTNPIY